MNPGMHWPVPKAQTYYSRQPRTGRFPDRSLRAEAEGKPGSPGPVLLPPPALTPVRKPSDRRPGLAPDAEQARQPTAPCPRRALKSLCRKPPSRRPPWGLGARWRPTLLSSSRRAVVRPPTGRPPPEAASRTHPGKATALRWHLGTLNRGFSPVPGRNEPRRRGPQKARGQAWPPARAQNRRHGCNVHNLARSLRAELCTGPDSCCGDQHTPSLHAASPCRSVGLFITVWKDRGECGMLQPWTEMPGRLESWPLCNSVEG